MVIVDMKRLPGKDDAPGAIAGPGASEPSYPYGLVLNLEAADLAKLGIGELPGAGEHMKIEAHVTVVNVGQNAEPSAAGGGKRMALQITHMGIEASKDTQDRLSDRLYGGSGGGLEKRTANGL